VHVLVMPQRPRIPTDPLCGCIRLCQDACNCCCVVLQRRRTVLLCAIKVCSRSVSKSISSAAALQSKKVTKQGDMLCSQITEESSELRLLLCRAKQDSSGKKSTSVVTACGIFISDIVEASPIDKYFEMFKPGSGKEGGFVRLRLNLITEDELRQKQQGAVPLFWSFNTVTG
jgi:hypothetical protein